MPVVEARRWLTWLALASTLPGCTTDHDQLAKQPDGAGSGGSGGSSSVATQSAASMTSSSSSSTSTTGGTSGGLQHLPDGEDILTLVHGQVDAERIAFCFAEIAEGERRFSDQPPTPEGGLAYGEHVSLSEPGGLSLAASTILPVVLAGDIDSVSDSSCERALEGAHWVRALSAAPDPGAAGAGGGGGAGGAETEPRPELRARELPTLPAETLVLGKNYVMVVAGCMGGPGVADDGLHCGPEFESGAPSLRPILAPVSRDTLSGRLSLQFMHASAASLDVDFRSRPFSGGPGLDVTLALDLGYGSLSPQQPLQQFASEDLGIVEGANIDVLIFGRRELEVPWVKAAELGGSAPIQNGESYLAILLGSALGSDSETGFNPSAVTLIPTGAGRDE